MKKLLFLLLLLPFFGLSQTTGYFRYDTVKFHKVGANSEFILENATRGNTNAFLQNYSQGRTRFAYALDSVWLDGDSIRFRYGSTTIAVHLGGGSSIDTTSLSNRINLKVNISDTAAMLAPYLYGFNNIGSTPNAQGASVGSHLITLQPADSSFGGLVTTGTQRWRGQKTILNKLFITQWDPGVGKYFGVTINHPFSTSSTVDGLRIGYNGGTGVSYIYSRTSANVDLPLHFQGSNLIFAATDTIGMHKSGSLSTPFINASVAPDSIIMINNFGGLSKAAIGSGLAYSSGVLSTTSPSTPNTIYSANDTLVDSRQVDMKGYSLEFLNSGLFRIQDTAGTVQGTYDFNEGIDYVVSDASNNVAVKADPTVGVSLKSGLVATNESRIELNSNGVSLSMRDSVGGTVNETITGDIYTHFNNPAGIYSFMAVPDSTTGNTYMAVLRESDSDPGNYELTKAPVPTGGGGETPNWARTTSNHTLVDNTTDQPIFPSANDAWTVEASTLYRVKGLFHFNMGATTHTTSIGFTLGGGASVTRISIGSNSWNNAPNASNTAQVTNYITQAAASPVTLFNTATTLTVWIDGEIAVNAAGTITPFVKFSTATGGTVETVAGSFFEMVKIGTTGQTSNGNVN